MREKRAELAAHWNLDDDDEASNPARSSGKPTTASETVDALTAKLATEL